MSKIKNRIIGSGIEKLDNILFNPRNWRIHPLNQQNALKGVLEEVGWVQEVIVNKTTGNLVDGHLRCQLAAREGETEIPVKYVELTPEEEALVLATIDPIAGMATTDKAKLDELFASIQSDSTEVNQMLTDIAEKERLEYGKKDIEDVEPQIDKAEELRVKWGIETGQMWQLGDHRIVCGDCTDKAVVERVMQREKASFCFTDPPYGVKYTGGTKKWEMLENDDDINMYALSLPIIFDFTEDKAALYLCFAGVLSESVFKALRLSYFTVRTEIIWNKNNAQFGALGAQYKQKHECIAYAFKNNQSPYWYGPNNEVTVWDIDRKNKNTFHPTEKPVELYERAMRNNAPDKCVIFEPFSGSGSAILACERLSRKCRAVEISPAYVAVSIQRWVDATGGTPELISEV